ncbi:hypothetical protein [Kribbella sp. VKM Ac-2571]|uniref:hypothetical protein n=1 Tax=Kribbella sp. VKM Ac-2571 TaxID=2512222 RepID=UPI00105CF394|nr:hypothetical protein [Kribbella sp. VKM Ac-2571]
MGGGHVRGCGEGIAEVGWEGEAGWAGGFGGAALEGGTVVREVRKLGDGLPELTPEAGAGDLEREI